MKTRTDRLSYAEPLMAMVLDLREAYALGTVLCQVKGKGPGARQARTLGMAMMQFSTAKSLKCWQAVVGELKGVEIDRRGRSGRLAAELIAGLERALDEADRMGEEKGRWMHHDGTEGEVDGVNAVDTASAGSGPAAVEQDKDADNE